MSNKFYKIAVAILFIAFVTSLAILLKPRDRSGYVFDNVKRSSVQEIISESGVITSDGNIEIYSPTNGRIEEIYVSNGDKIEANQKLFKVTSSALEEEKKLAYANYLSAKSTLDIDNSNLYSLQSSMFSAWDKHYNLAIDSKYQYDDKSPNYANRALPEYATANADWLAAESAYKSQVAVIAKDKVALTAAYQKYLSTITLTVSSPLSGIVENIAYSKGKSVNIKDPLLNSTTPVLIIKNSDDLEATISVGQTNIAKIEINQAVIIKPDAYRDKSYTGTIARIDGIGKNIEGVVTYNVYVKIKSDNFLRSGITFDSEITTKSLDDILVVPNSAVITQDGIKNIRVIEKNKVKNIPVQVGLKGQTNTEIISGLTEGQEIISGLTNEKAAKPGFMGL